MFARRSLALFGVVVALALLLGNGQSVVAQPVPPLAGALPTFPMPTPSLDLVQNAFDAFPHRLVQGASPVVSLTPAVPIGQPGLSFRYVQTFGETEMPYFEDTIHLNAPGGLGFDGANVWIVECDGRRALKYTSGGAFLTKIGRGGVSYGTGTTLWCPRDVTIDNSGNVWLVASGEHIAKYDAAGSFVRQWGQIWNSGASNDRFEDIQSIAIDTGGNFYVSDSGNHRIQVFNANGDYVTTLGVTGNPGSDNTHFNHPRHIIIDSNNRLYVADRDNHRVQIYDVSALPTVVYLATIGEAAQSGSDNSHLNAPQGVAVDVARGRIFVADAGNWRVQVFDLGSRAYQATLSGFSFIEDVAVDAAGNLYISEPWSDRNLVQQFDTSSLTRTRVYGIAGIPYRTDGSHFFYPLGVAVAPDGSIYIGEEIGRRLIKLSSDGTLLWIVGEPGWWGSDNAHFSYINDVALDAMGRVYVTDGANCRVQIFRPNGNYFATLGAGCGANNDQFSRPYGLTVAPNGDIYVADPENQRVQVFNSGRSYIATLGMTGVATSSNAGFNQPIDVAVDSRGMIYVSDLGNRRIQVFDSNRVYVRTIGTTGVSGAGFDRLGGPHHLAVDASDNLYIADPWNNNRVQVFDKNGAYLTTIDGRFGAQPGQNRGPRGLAVDAEGNVYFADWDNARIQKFAPGVPGWKQVNINGFGDRGNTWISSMASFKGRLYATGSRPYVWRLENDGTWTTVNTLGFGDSTNSEIDAMAAFEDRLYVATFTFVCDDPNCDTWHTNGPQFWRTVDGNSWENVTPSGSIGTGYRWVPFMASFGGYLYATLERGDQNTLGAEIWRTADGHNWQQIATGGFGDPYNTGVLALAHYNDYLYAGTRHGDWQDDAHPDGPLGGEVWRYDGTNWVRVNISGFADLEAHRVEKLLVFNNGLYAYVSRVGGSARGAEVWRCSASVCNGQSDWQKVVDNGFGYPGDQYLLGGTVFEGHLYAIVQSATGMKIWRTFDGQNWVLVNSDGLGDGNNAYVWRNAAAVHNDRLYLGVINWANGGEIWQKTVTADFSANPTVGAPPLAVSFTNTSAGDYTSSRWDFGDGQISTAANPTHTYTAIGMYTVTLTVSDGMDTHTITRPAFIRTTHRLFLPLAMQKYDPTLYDDFDDPAYEGTWNPQLWTWAGAEPFHAAQRNGVMVLGNTASTANDAWLKIPRPLRRSPQQTWSIAARMKMSSDRSGGYSSLQLKTHAFVNGHGWAALCALGGSEGAANSDFGCSIMVPQGSDWTFEYRTPERPLSYDSWHVARIEIAPVTAELRFYLDDVLIGRHIPADAAALAATTALTGDIHLWHGDVAASTRYLDDVRITPAP